MTEAATEVPVVLDGAGPVDVVIDAPKPNDGGQPAEAPKAAVVTEDEGIETLRQQAKAAREEAERERAAKIAAARQLAESEARAKQLEEDQRSTRKDAVSQLIQSLTQGKEAAVKDFRLALEAGDAAKAAEAQDRIATLAARLVKAEEGKVALDERQPTQAQPIYVDNVEKLARQLSPRSADWIRRHPEYAEPGDKNDRMIRAHHAAIGEGIIPETDDYFVFINRKLGLEKAPEAEARPAAAATQDRAPISAPVGRDVSAAPRRSTPGTVRLTPDEVATAKALDMSLEDYAKHLVALAKDGKINRQF